jgi:hypothetical protein
MDEYWMAWQQPIETWTPAGSYMDDLGTHHMWTKDKPKIACLAHQALALIEMGLDPDQIHATFGERFTSGSNANSNFAGYYNSHMVGGDHAQDTTYMGTLHFPADPTPEEQALLAGILDLSPGCSASNGWCAAMYAGVTEEEGFNVTLFDVHGYPDIVISGPMFDAYTIPPSARAKLAENNVKVIQISPAKKAAEGEPLPGTAWETTKPPQHKSYLELVTQFEELAIALGADKDQMRTDKENLCHQISKFKEITFHAAQRGVRAMGGVLPIGDFSEDGKIGGWLSNVDKSPTLMMLEELGMQIIHLDTTNDGYYESHYSGWPPVGTMDAENLMSTGSRTAGRVKVPYNVDFWLPEVRTYLDFISPEFAEAWPHPAVVAKQYAYFPGAYQVMRYTFRHAADILRLVGNKLAVAKKLDDDPADTQCTRVEDIDGDYHRTAGLAPGQYACWNPIAYDYCGHVLHENWKQQAHEDGYVCSFGAPPNAHWEARAREAGWNPPCPKKSRSRKMDVPFANRQLSSSHGKMS